MFWSYDTVLQIQISTRFLIKAWHAHNTLQVWFRLYTLEVMCVWCLNNLNVTDYLCKHNFVDISADSSAK